MVEMKLDQYQLFSIRTCINFGLVNFLWKFILAFKMDHVIDVFMYSLIPINQNSDVQI